MEELDLNNAESQEQLEETLQEEEISHSPTTEIFLGGVPRTITDEELHEILQASADTHHLGSVTGVRLMKDRTTGEPKGFAFATFATRKDALLAAQVLNNMEIKGKNVRVTISENRCRIFIGNIPKDIPRDDFMTQLNQQGDGIVNVDFLKDPDDPTRNRGFAFVEYKDHPSAERARRNLSKTTFRLGKHLVTVNWADPQPEADDELMSQVKVLYIRNLPNEPVTEEALREVFAQYGEIERVVIPPSVAGQKRRDFCFVHYVERESAHAAVHSPERHLLNGRTLEVTLAKPMDKKQREENRIRKQARAMRRVAGVPQMVPVPMGLPPMIPPPGGRGPGLLGYGTVPPAGAPLLPLPLSPTSASTTGAAQYSAGAAGAYPYPVAYPYPYAYPYPGAYPAGYPYGTYAPSSPGKYTSQQPPARYHPYQ